MKLSKTQDGILYLYDYYPTRFIEHRGISEKIIAFKNGNTDAIDFFCRVMKDVLDERFKDNLSGLGEYTVCIMPAHDRGMYSVGLRLLAKFLVNTYGMTDGIELVRRIKTHDRNANGGDRSIAGQLQTLAIDDGYAVADKKILLLDDVTTSGNSILAVRRLLTDRGNNWFVSIALGRTTYPVIQPEIPDDLPFDIADPATDDDKKTESDNEELAAVDFEITQLENTDITKWNIDEIKQQLEKTLSVYKNMVYTDSSIKSAKKDKADLNKAKKIIEDARKAYKRQCLEPYETLEPRIIELTNMIEVQRIAIDEVVKDYERKRIEKKEEKIRSYYDEMSSPLGEYADTLYGMLRDPKWFNVSTDRQKYEEGIRSAIIKAAEDISTIRKLNSPFFNTVIEKYTNTLSLQQAISKHEELMLAADKAGLSDSIVEADDREGQGWKKNTNKRIVRILADDEQFDKILKYIESVGAKCVIDE